MKTRRSCLCLLVVACLGCSDDASPPDAALPEDATEPVRDVPSDSMSDGRIDDIENTDVPFDSGADDASARDADATPLSVLVFSRTAGFRHRSIVDGVRCFEELARAQGWRLEATEDAARIAADVLSNVDVVVFLNTSGDILGPAQETSLREWVLAGGGWVGVHAASDTEYDWPWYGELLGGAWFERHPAIQDAVLNVEDGDHPATRHLAAMWRRRDEWYDFRSSPRPTSRVLITLDESSYEGGGDGADHPITWSRSVGAGRSFYTAFGHTSESYAEPDFRTLLEQAVVWAAGAE